jgi:hypothetical protein
MGVPAGVAVYAPNPGAPGSAGVEQRGGALMNASRTCSSVASRRGSTSSA